MYEWSYTDANHTDTIIPAVGPEIGYLMPAILSELDGGHRRVGRPASAHEHLPDGAEGGQGDGDVRRSVAVLDSPAQEVLAMSG